MSENLKYVPKSIREERAAKEIATIHEANTQLRNSESLVKPAVRFAEGTQTRIRADRPLKPLDRDSANSFAELSDVDVSTLSPDDQRYFELDRDDLATGDRILQTAEEAIPDRILADEDKEWDRSIKAAKLKIAQEGITPIKTKAELQLDQDETDKRALRAEIRKIKNKWWKEEDAHAKEARDKMAQWQKDDTNFIEEAASMKGEVAAKKQQWWADHIQEADKAFAAVRVETEIKNNPTGPLAKLRERIRKILSKNR